MAEMVLETLPKVAAEVAAPLTRVKHIKLVCTGDGEIGASKLTREVLDVVCRMPIVVEQLTGFGIADAFKKGTHAARH